MGENMRVSVVIPTYRRAFPVLLQAVESVLRQTRPADEVIVVSDNPPDSEQAREIAQGLAAYPAVTLLQLPRNSGANAARNAGIRAASGELIAFLDDDDLWLERKLEMQTPLFAEETIGLVYCRGYLFHGQNTGERQPYYNETEGGFHTSATFAQLLRQDWIGSTSQAIVRRTCFDACGFFDETLPARQDYDRWLAITQKYKAAGVDEPLFMHRMHDGQMTKNTQVALDANARVFRKYAPYYRVDRVARMRYYYRRAFLLRSLKKKTYGLTALWAFCCAPGAFIRQYRAYRKE